MVAESRWKAVSGAEFAEVVWQVARGGLRPPLNPKWPPPLRDTLSGCWAADQQERSSLQTEMPRLEAVLRQLEESERQLNEGIQQLLAKQQQPGSRHEAQRGPDAAVRVEVAREDGARGMRAPSR